MHGFENETNRAVRLVDPPPPDVFWIIETVPGRESSVRFQLEEFGWCAQWWDEDRVRVCAPHMVIDRLTKTLLAEDVKGFRLYGE